MTLFPTRRVYDPPQSGDGARILVDRLWPRGVARDRVDLWLKDIAPSEALRKRFHGHPEEWDAFVSAYAEELQTEAARIAVETLRARCRAGPVTLLYAARDEQRNNAVALQQWLESPAARRG